MNCDWIKENVVLYIYDELADDAKYEFEQHASHCLSCRQEVESALAFKNAMSETPVQEVSPNLLVASRLQLQESLDETVQSHGWNRFVFDLAGWMHQLKLAPALTAAILMVGFAGGSLTTWRLVGSRPPVVVSPPPDEANIAGIESITPDANSNKVAIKYDLLYPQTMEGTPDNPRIHQLLLMATRNTSNSGVRLDSIDVLTQAEEDNAVREALVYALRYDNNPGVRLKSLDGLKNYVKDDVHVRDAVVEALMHDSNGGVRSEAITLLDPVRADMSVHEALQVLARHDKDPFIRSESRRYLESTPNLY
ncbi:MAG TPA: HEAT repeat domain-containing protein [Candidatus Angelobacter sp.]|nr:HEAT repeat domain-containing protein [Candidatus Angelobacter sp.]